MDILEELKTSRGSLRIAQVLTIPDCADQVLLSDGYYLVIKGGKTKSEQQYCTLRNDRGVNITYDILKTTGGYVEIIGTFHR